jgi:magnesium-transporting ATPase (P-type)
MSTPIFTAIEFRNDDFEDDITSMVTQPLLNDEVGYGDEENEKMERPSRQSFSRFILIGVVTGFLIQMISLGAYAFMLTQYGDEQQMLNKSESDWLVYSVLSVLTQVDLLIYVMIWLAFTCTMTRNGMAIIRFQYQAPVKRRFIFVLGVYFLVGIVLGAFVAWTLIDLYLNFPIPFVPIAATVVIDLVLCYLMVFCYDLGREETIEDEEDTACC